MYFTYSGSFLKWTREPLGNMDNKTRKSVIMHKALHERDFADRPTVTRKD